MKSGFEHKFLRLRWGCRRILLSILVASVLTIESFMRQVGCMHADEIWSKSLCPNICCFKGVESKLSEVPELHSLFPSRLYLEAHGAYKLLRTGRRSRLTYGVVSKSQRGRLEVRLQAHLSIIPKSHEPLGRLWVSVVRSGTFQLILRKSLSAL